MLVAKHNELMVRFKRTGVSSVLSKVRDLFVIRNNSPFLTKAAIKVLPSIDGLMFSGCLEIINDSTQYMLLDKMGCIRHYSPSLETLVKRKGVMLSTSEIFAKDIVQSNGKIYSRLSAESKHLLEVFHKKNREEFPERSSIKMESNVTYLSIEDVTIGICQIKYARGSHNEEVKKGSRGSNGSGG